MSCTCVAECTSAVDAMGMCAKCAAQAPGAAGLTLLLASSCSTLAKGKGPASSFSSCLSAGLTLL